jgi:hypothetical protein
LQLPPDRRTIRNVALLQLATTPESSLER